jgi:hypothetical protein
MKKLLLLLLFIPLVSFGQNDFRKMFWGESQEVLKEKYPDAEFVSEKGGGMTTLSNTDSANFRYKKNINDTFITKSSRDWCTKVK